MSDQEIDAVEFVRHLRALDRTLAGGFTFEFERGADGSATTLHGIRCRPGMVDTYTVYGPDEAVAARYRPDEYGHADGVALWETAGGVIDVLNEVLALPTPDGRGSQR